MGRLMNLEYGESLPEHCRRPDSIPVMGSNGIVGYHDEALVKGPAIVVGRKGSVGEVNWVDKECFPIDTTYYVENRQPSSTLMQFLYRLLQLAKLDQRRDPGAVPGLSRNVVHSLQTAIPGRPEQQKIADCLRSLDEVIAAQGRKVAALKTYKQGLMQQLFPREGETVPRLRFPEFRDGPAWRETRLNSLGELVSGLTYSPNDVRDSGLLVLRSSNVQNGEIAIDDNVYVTPSIKGANLARPNDILICVRNGSKALIGKSALIPEGMPPCTHGAFMTVFRASAPHFAFHLLQLASFQKQVAVDLGATINSINGSQLLKYRFIVPEKDEQKRVAELLSCLSSWIGAEFKKLATLKAHKKGLMQQLFPQPEEV